MINSKPSKFVLQEIKAENGGLGISDTVIDGPLPIYAVDPISLINDKRFDIMAKYIYGLFKEKGIESKWGLELYEEHIRVSENNEEKNGFVKEVKDTFITSFNSILRSVKENNFNDSPIPIGRNNELLGGAHRLAASLLYEKQIAIVKSNESGLNLNYQFFKNRGLETKWCDAIAYEYCKLKRNTFIVVLYPSAVGKLKETKLVLGKYGQIFYEKEIYLRGEGPKNIILQLYKGERWLGDFKGNFQGAYEKVIPCFNNRGPMRVFVFETNVYENVLKAKEEIRDLYNIGKHSVHINDTHEETIRLAQTFFNENSIHFLNHAKPNTYIRFVKLFNNYKNYIYSQKFNSDNFCIDTSAVLAAYGIREPSDLDFIHFGYDHIPNMDLNDLKIASHNSELNHHTKTKDDIIFNPENHFYFDGFKFASLNVIKSMKKQRGELKDLEDIRLINKYLRKREFDIALILKHIVLRYRSNILKAKSQGKILLGKLFKYQ